MSSTPEGTGPLSIHAAIDNLLAVETPPEENQDGSELPAEAEAAADDTPDAEATAEEAETADAEDDDQDDVAEEEEGDAEEEGSEDVYSVRVNGEDVDVSFDELVRGYQRQGDYTRKTQAVSEERKTLESEMANLTQAQQEAAQTRDLMLQRLQELEPMLQGAANVEPNWDELREQDPIEYMVQRDQHRDRQEQLRKVHEEQQVLLAQQQQEQAHAWQQHVVKERDVVLQRIPEWQDADVMSKEQSELVEYLESKGFSKEELGSASDSRAIELSRKAMLWDRAQQNLPKAKAKAKSAPKMVRAGQPKTKKESSSRRRKEKLAAISKTRGRDSVDAAVSLLLEN